MRSFNLSSAVVAAILIVGANAAAQTSSEIYQIVQTRMDTDGNGVVSRQEFVRYWRDEPGTFDTYDTNHDGMIYGSEFETVGMTIEEYATYECDPELDGEFPGSQNTCLMAYIAR